MHAHARTSPDSSPDSVSHHRFAGSGLVPPRCTKCLTCGNAEDHQVPLRPPARSSTFLAFGGGVHPVSEIAAMLVLATDDEQEAPDFAALLRRRTLIEDGERDGR